jgi:orotate phosphoribosyltransferase
VVTTGSTLASYIERLRTAGATVERAVAVVDREEGGEKALRRIGVRLEVLLRADEILEHGQQP